MRINQNTAALSAYRSNTTNQAGLEKAMERLSSGLRINRAADDASGLAISENLRAQVNGLNQAKRNTLDGISVMQTAEGALNETHAILQRMRTLAVQAANGTNSKDNLEQIQAEMVQSMAELDHIADGIRFNGMPLLDGTFVEKDFQIGANAGDSKTVTIGTKKSEPIPPTPAGFAVWGLDDAAERAKLPDPFVVEQTLPKTGETVSVSVKLEPLPQSAGDLANLLKADPTFSANFDVELGDFDEIGKAPRPDANIIIIAKDPGASPVTVPGSDAFAKIQTEPGTDETAAQYGGYHAAELLDGPVDVRTEASSTTIPVPPQPPTPPRTTTVERFGHKEVVTIPGSRGSDGYTRTDTQASGATRAIEQIDRAIARVSAGRAEMGATHNVFEHTARNLGVSAENMTHAESRIRDADIAEEFGNMKRWQLLCQSSISMLQQANQLPQQVAKLLG